MSKTINTDLDKKLAELQKSQKWDCYRMDPAGFIREAGWPMTRSDVAKFYSPAALAAAQAELAARWDALYELATTNQQLSEDEFVALTVRQGFYR